MNNKTTPHTGSTIDPLMPEMAPFWEAFEQGQLMLKECESCHEKHFYPRAHCPFCGHHTTRWFNSAGKGTVYSFSIDRRASPLAATAVIELEGAVRMVGTVIEADVQQLDIGHEVVLYPKLKNGRHEIAFTTEAAQQARAYAAQALARAAQPAGVAAVPAPDFASAAVVGAGNMGMGIAMAFANAGIPVTLIDRDIAFVRAACDKIAAQYRSSVQRGRLDAAEAAARLARITPSSAIADVAPVDVIVEAVWEQMEVKREIFGQIDQHAKAGALLGTNTSGLDIGAVGDCTQRPADVIGLHFFSPANVMKLLEIVRGRATSEHTITRAFALARALGKSPVLVESCPGFAGNRILRKREAQSRAMLIEGATPEQIDRVQKEFGLPMGSFELADMSAGVELDYRKSLDGLEISWLTREMYQRGRLGQKTQKGYYRYEAGSRKPRPDPEMSELLKEASAQAGVQRRALSDEEVRERLVLSMVNEAAHIVQEGVVQRASDIDAVWLSGYGWPTWRGGILYHADQLGAAHIRERLRALQASHGDHFRPAALIEQLADAGIRFQDLPEQSTRAAAFTG